MERAAGLVEPIKPRLRGWLHAGMIPAALIAGLVLICLARAPQAIMACVVHSVTARLLFATSANIFLIIAGTCTPLAVLLLPPDQRSV